MLRQRLLSLPISLCLSLIGALVTSEYSIFNFKLSRTLCSKQNQLSRKTQYHGVGCIIIVVIFAIDMIYIHGIIRTFIMQGVLHVHNKTTRCRAMDVIKLVLQEII
jgi:hypothetical protein